MFSPKCKKIIKYLVNLDEEFKIYYNHFMGSLPLLTKLRMKKQDFISKHTMSGAYVYYEYNKDGDMETIDLSYKRPGSYFSFKLNGADSKYINDIKEGKIEEGIFSRSLCNLKYKDENEIVKNFCLYLTFKDDKFFINVNVVIMPPYGSDKTCAKYAMIIPDEKIKELFYSEKELNNDDIHSVNCIDISAE